MKHYVPFLSEETKQLMKERNVLKEEATKLQDEKLMTEYRRIRNTSFMTQLFHPKKPGNLYMKFLGKSRTSHHQRSGLKIKLSLILKLLQMHLIPYSKTKLTNCDNKQV